MRLLWGSTLLGVVLGFLGQWVAPTRVPVSRAVANGAALALMLCGLALRWSAILTLGKFFTVDVAIRPDHEVIRDGPYRFMRHPSYSGLLIAFLGFGAMFANWASIVGVMVPITLGVLQRVVREEQVLRTSLGEAYEVYARSTKRFLPGLF